MKMTSWILLAASLTAWGTARAAVVMDGVADAAYGAPLVTQTHQTQFGDSSTGTVDTANGSELDNAYAVVEGTNLFVFLAGNLEANFNKLEVFIDTGLGGQNKLRGDNPNVDGNGLNRMGDDGSLTNGLRFDADFDADYWIGITGGGAPYSLYANYAQLNTDASSTNGYYLGSTGAGTDGVLAPGFNPYGIRISINNSNVAGVAGGSAPAAPFAAVNTGIELAIPLAALGWPCGSIKVCAFVSSGDHGFLSNQTLPGFATTNDVANLGEPRNVHFNELPGSQWFRAAYIGLTNDYEFVVSKVTATNGGAAISWPSNDGKSYFITKSTNLLQGFTVLTNGVLATAPTNTFVDPTGDANSFYQVQARSGCP